MKHICIECNASVIYHGATLQIAVTEVAQKIQNMHPTIKGSTLLIGLKLKLYMPSLLNFHLN